jgi:hypothetical protein
MSIGLKVLGWSLRASAAICITWIVVGVVSGAAGLTTIAGIAGSVAFHAAFALSGTQLVGCAKRLDARRVEAASVA